MHAFLDVKAPLCFWSKQNDIYTGLFCVFSYCSQFPSSLLIIALDSLLRSRLSGCHATLPRKREALRDIPKDGCEGDYALDCMPLGYMPVEHWTTVRKVRGYKHPAPTKTQGLRRKCCLCNDMCKWLDSLVFFDKDCRPHLTTLQCS